MIKRFWYHLLRRRYQVLTEAEDFLLLTWDSCRYDAFTQARKNVLDRFGPARRAWAMGTYTLPSHMAMYYGFLPHAFSPEPLYNRYHQQLWRICHRNVLVKPLVTFPLGTRNVVCGFRERGYFTVGLAAMDWFRDAPSLQDGFAHFEVTGTGARRQHERLIQLLTKRAARRPLFAMINYGETHSPFRHEGMSEVPRAGDDPFTLRRLFNQQHAPRADWEFDQASFARQVACAEYLDAQTQTLLDFVERRGRPTTVVLCADHGECFGEQGLYGHAFYHEKVMEVPLLIFRLNAAPHAAPQASAAAERHAAHQGSATVSEHETVPV